MQSRFRSAKAKAAGRIMKRAYSTAARAPAKRQLTTMVKQIMNKATDQKYIDTYLTSPADGIIVPVLYRITEETNNNKSVQFVSGIAIGAAPYQRVGNKVKLQSIRIKGQIEALYGYGTPFQLFGTAVRVMIVVDKKPDNSGASPSFEEICGGLDDGGAVNRDWTSGIVPSQNPRFRVLSDKTYDLNVPTMTPAVTKYDPGTELTTVVAAPVVTNQMINNLVDFDVYVDCSKKNIEMKYQDNSVALTSVESNAVYVVAIASQSDRTWVYPRFNSGTCRIRYSDL